MSTQPPPPPQPQPKPQPKPQPQCRRVHVHLPVPTLAHAPSCTHACTCTATDRAPNISHRTHPTHALQRGERMDDDLKEYIIMTDLFEERGSLVLPDHAVETAPELSSLSFKAY